MRCRPRRARAAAAPLPQESNTIRVWNNGDGIPVEVHKEEGVYVPELIFGHLLTSSNYDDSQKKVRAPLAWRAACVAGVAGGPQAGGARVRAACCQAVGGCAARHMKMCARTSCSCAMRRPPPTAAAAAATRALAPSPAWPQITGGRNGYGAKLANIFSTRFTVETADGKRGRRFAQTFSANMSAKTAPKISACKASDNWTCITFEPDLAKFDMTVRAVADACIAPCGRV